MSERQGAGASLEVRVAFVSGHEKKDPQVLRLAAGTSLREVLKILSLPVEGCALFWNGSSVPADLALKEAGSLEIVSTFSGG